MITLKIDTSGDNATLTAEGDVAFTITKPSVTECLKSAAEVMRTLEGLPLIEPAKIPTTVVMPSVPQPDRWPARDRFWYEDPLSARLS